jgi:hypothetical protein
VFRLNPIVDAINGGRNSDRIPSGTQNILFHYFHGLPQSFQRNSTIVLLSLDHSAIQRYNNYAYSRSSREERLKYFSNVHFNTILPYTHISEFLLTLYIFMQRSLLFSTLHAAETLKFVQRDPAFLRNHWVSGLCPSSGRSCLYSLSLPCIL